MSEKPKTIRIPDEPIKSEPAFAFVGDQERKLLVAGKDEHGRPLYAPVGYRPWWWCGLGSVI